MQTLKKSKKTTRTKNKTHCVIVSGVHSALNKVGLAKEIQKNIKGSSSYKYLDPCLNVLKPKTTKYKHHLEVMTKFTGMILISSMSVNEPMWPDQPGSLA